MCFSATASLVGCAVIVVAGVYAIRFAWKPQELFFASILIVLAEQQVTKGFIWFTTGM